MNLFNKSQDSYTIEPTNNILFKSDLYKTSTTYLIKFDVVSSNTDNKFMLQYYLNGQWLANYELNIKLGINKFVITSTSNQFDTIRLYYNSSYGSETVELKDIMLIEYQQGMENWDIPYFEGMQSVKMPVLTTTGKNLFNMNAIVQDDFELNKYQTGYYGKEFTLQPNTTYTIKAYLREDITNTSVWTAFNVIIQGKVFNVLNVDKTGTSGQNEIRQMTFTTDSTGKVCYSIYSHLNSRVSWLGNLPFNIQLEKGTTETSYEPYQSNILTTSEELELRGIGNVQDELDCLTGEVNQRIGEIVVDGSSDEDWYISDGGSDTHTRFVMRRGSNLKPIYNINQNGFLCDKFKRTTVISESSNDEKCLMERFDNYFISIVIDNTKLNSVDVDGFRLWLQSNPVKFNYIFEDESIKTVDLTTVNEKGETTYFMPLEGTMNVQSTGEIIQPTFDMSVPVEATTQNLASFIDLEME